MQAVPKQEVKRRIGSSSFWFPTQLVGDLKYASGIEAFDDQIDSSFLLDLPVNVIVHEDGWEFQMQRGLETTRVPIRGQDLVQACFERAEEVIRKKDRSVIGRALAGGFLMGPVGAIVGGMTGLKDKEVDQTPDSFLTVNVSNDGRYEVSKQTHVLTFTVAKNDLESVETFFGSNFPGNVIHSRSA